MTASLDVIYERLYAWCSARGFAGVDPFDALNSRVFQATPLRKFRLPRLALTQLVKRSPINLRVPLGIDPDVNPKAVALFGLAELSRYRATSDKAHAKQARQLLDMLLDLGMHDGEALAYGYNFDWQSRVFFAPKGTPTIVPMAFASQAFVEGGEAFADKRYGAAVQEIARFAATGLNRPVETDDEICFSYTTLDEGIIYNASLLAAECLIRSEDASHHELARKALNFVVRRQRDDGAWSYGDGDGQGWVDNFHTAYVLQSISSITKQLGTTDEIEKTFERGMRYWLDRFFLDDGTPRYYDDRTAPIDIHSAGVAIAALAELGEVAMARKVADWTVRNMLDVDGYFYYRVNSIVVNQTAFMRWGQAWMAYALARLMEAEAP